MKEREDYIFGIHAVWEALKEGKDVSRIMLQQGLRGEASSGMLKMARERNIDIQFVPVQRLNRVTRKNHQGVIAFISPVEYHLTENILPVLFETGKNPLFIMLDRVTDVRNFGAICRSAECMGVDAVIIPLHGSALINADAIKTSAGALHKIPVCREGNLKNTIEFLKQSGVSIVGCSEKGNKTLENYDFTGPVCVIMGSEEDGISKEYLRKCDDVLQIPMQGSTGSLNVSVSAGIILYEVVRQRSKS